MSTPTSTPSSLAKLRDALVAALRLAEEGESIASMMAGWAELADELDARVVAGGANYFQRAGKTMAGELGRLIDDVELALEQPRHRRANRPAAPCLARAGPRTTKIRRRDAIGFAVAEAGAAANSSRGGCAARPVAVKPRNGMFTLST